MWSSLLIKYNPKNENINIYILIPGAFAGFPSPPNAPANPQLIPLPKRCRPHLNSRLRTILSKSYPSLLAEGASH